MSTPFSFSGSFNLPADVGLPADPIAIAFSSQFDSEAQYVLNLSGTGTKAVALGTMPAAGIKGLLIKVDAGASVQPVLVSINSSATGKVEIAAGGFVALGNPVPVAGITALDIVYASSCVVRVWALG